MKENWYHYCVQQAIYWLKQNSTEGWIHWWCARNKFLWNLTDQEIECYRKYKTKNYIDLYKEIIVTSNGKPRESKCKLHK